MNNRAPSKPQRVQHIIILGASGASGLAFIKHHISLPENNPSKPYLTLYIRPSGRSKLLPVLPNASSSSTPGPHIRIIEGELTDSSALRRALSADNNSTNSFPAVTAVVSLLGAYMSLYYFLTRATPTPLADAFTSTVIPAMREAGVKRVLVLSTPTAFPVAGEKERMSWGWWFHNLMPLVVVPQGSAEMKGLAEAVMGKEGKGEREGFEVTVFRVPFLTDEEGEREREVVVGFLGPEFTETKTLARAGMVRWLVSEVEKGEWIGKAPMLCDR